jgi:CheY-like chemotaxis protein
MCRTESRVHKPSVLIVDDDREAIKAFHPMLKQHGYEARAAYDAQAALEEIERCLPDVILLDLHLPIIDGIELLRRLKLVRRFAEIPVAILTGDYLIDDELTAEVDRLGSRLHYKPLWEEDILQIVGSLLRQSDDRSLPV